MPVASISDLIVKVGADIVDFETGMSKTTRVLDKMVEGILSPAGIIAGITAIGVTAFNAAEVFDKAGDDIGIKTGAVGTALESLKTSFDNVFKQVPNDAAAVATAISDLNVKLGLTGVPLEAMATQFLTLSRLMKEDVGVVIGATTDAFKKWGVAATDQAATLETFRQAAVSSGMSMGDFTSALTASAPALQAAGLDLQSAIEIIGSLRLAGQDVEALMPALGKALQNMAKEGIDPKLGFPALVEGIKNAKTETEAISIAGEEFGAKGGLKFVQAIRSGALETGAFTEKLSANKQTIAELALQSDDFGETWGTTWHKIQSMLVPIGDGIRFVITELVLDIERLVQWVGKVGEAWTWLNTPLREGIAEWKKMLGISPAIVEEQKPLVTQTKAVKTATDDTAVAFVTAKEKAKALKDEEKALKEELERLETQQQNDLSNAKYYIKAKEDAAIAAAKYCLQLADLVLNEVNANIQGEALDVEMKALALTTDNLTASTKALFDKMAASATAASGIDSVGTAYSTLGITVTSADLQKKSDDLWKAYETLATSGAPSLYDLQVAWVAVQEADKLALAAVGEWTPALETALQASKTKLGEMQGHVTPLKNAWTELATNIKGAVGGAIDDMVVMLFDGDFSFGKRLTQMWKDIGISVVDMFITPAKNAITEFISTTIVDLLSGKGLGGVLQNIKDIGSSLKDALGIGSGAASTAGGVASAGGGAASTGGGVASAVGGGLTGWLSAIGSIGSMVTGAIGDVQNMKIEKTLSLIEESTRYTWILFNGFIAENVGNIASRLGWDGGPLSGIHDRVLKLYDIMDGLVSIDDRLKNDLVPDLKAIREASGSPEIVVNIEGSVIGESAFVDKIANAFYAKLKLQGAIA